MKELYEKLINEDVSLKNNSFWYILGNLCSSLSSVLLLMYVTRILGIEEAGVFSIAYSISQLMLSVGWFGTRQFQVSDIKEKYEFKDYLTFKMIISFFCILGGIINSIFIGNYGYKLWITFLFCIFILCDVFADLFAARFQQLDKLHIAGKSYVLRIIGYNIVFLISLLLFHSLSISLVLIILYSLFELLVFDFILIKKTSEIHISFCYEKIISLIKECFPLFIGSFLSLFIINTPKNAIEMYLSSSIQTCYNIIFMPSSVINLFCMFIFVPLYTTIAKLWNEGNVKSLMKIIKKISISILLLAIVILTGGFLLGIPILSSIYSVDLSSYKLTLMILLVGGVFSACNYVLSYIITVVRMQKYITFIYFLTAILAQIIIKKLIIIWGVVGAALCYTISMFIVTFLFIILFIYILKKTI